MNAETEEKNRQNYYEAIAKGKCDAGALVEKAQSSGTQIDVEHLAGLTTPEFIDEHLDAQSLTPSMHVLMQLPSHFDASDHVDSTFDEWYTEFEATAKDRLNMPFNSEMPRDWKQGVELGYVGGFAEAMRLYLLS